MSAEDSSQDTSVPVPLVYSIEYSVDESSELLPSHTDNVEPISCPPRRIPRVSKQLIWMKDYVLPGKRRGIRYPISNYLSYNNTTPSYKSYVSSFSYLLEPQFFSQAAIY